MAAKTERERDLHFLHQILHHQDSMSSQGKYPQYRGILRNPTSSLRRHNSNAMTFEVRLTLPKAFNNRWGFLRQDYLQARRPGCHPTNSGGVQRSQKTVNILTRHANVSSIMPMRSSLLKPSEITVPAYTTETHLWLMVCFSGSAYVINLCRTVNRK